MNFLPPHTQLRLVIYWSCRKPSSFTELCLSGRFGLKAGRDAKPLPKKKSSRRLAAPIHDSQSSLQPLLARSVIDCPLISPPSRQIGFFDIQRYFVYRNLRRRRLARSFLGFKLNVNPPCGVSQHFEQTVPEATSFRLKAHRRQKITAPSIQKTAGPENYTPPSLEAATRAQPRQYPCCEPPSILCVQPKREIRHL
jgi:hypothetical protein